LLDLVRIARPRRSTDQVPLPIPETNVPEMDDDDWERLIRQIRRGDCTPFLGAGACHPTLPTGRALSRAWADEEDYPFEDRHNLARVMQYVAVRDPVEVKQRLAEQLRACGHPPRDGRIEPHHFLAALDLPVYLTTNYDHFMAHALRAAGKQPYEVVCPWFHGAPRGDPIYQLPPEAEPGADRPLVYHLHGNIAGPQSLVLTEDDYVEFLINLAIDRTNGYRRLLPLPVVDALARPLLFIGYSLEDWDFRVIFRGMLRATAEVQRRSHISVQIKPLSPEADADARRRAERYLMESLAHWRVSVFWGSASEFCAELAQRLKGDQ
jgi:SIR2-like domain